MHSSSPTKGAFWAWMDLASDYTRMSMSAGEVILRRSERMASGAMTQPEAMAMMLEKGTAFAAAWEKAAVAAAGGGNATRIARAALGPYGAKTKSNARKLRR